MNKEIPGPEDPEDVKAQARFEIYLSDNAFEFGVRLEAESTDSEESEVVLEPEIFIK